MWPFSKKCEVEVGVVAVEVPAKKEVECPPFGSQVAGLVRFGDTWLNLNAISAIAFGPPDGCGAECRYKNSSHTWHFSQADGLAIRTYLENFEQIGKQVDNAQA